MAVPNKPTNGDINWGTTLNTALDWLDSNKLSTWVTVPTSATAAGTAGQVARDSSYLYVCVATNTWKRVALSSW